MAEITAFKLGAAGLRDEFIPQTIVQSMFFFLITGHIIKSPCWKFSKFCFLREDQKILSWFYNGGL